jgi:hypothetical protein
MVQLEMQVKRAKYCSTDACGAAVGPPTKPNALKIRAMAKPESPQQAHLSLENPLCPAPDC